MKKIFVLFLTCFAGLLLEILPLDSTELKAQISQIPQIPQLFKQEEVKILAFGDIMMGRYVRVLMEKNGLYYPFKKTFADKEWLSRFDLITGNLEGPITERFITGGTSMTFGFPEDTAQLLKNLGFDALGLSNNHMHDRGISGYEETRKYLKEADLGYYGNYNSPELSPGYFAKIGDKKVAFLGINDVFGILDVEKAENLIREVKKGVDYVVVFPHWGIEYAKTPSERQKEFGRRFIDAGASAVVGHHPHVVQSHEIYNGKPIFYSLGNFIFDQYFRSDVQEGLAVSLTFQGKKISFELFPMKSVMSQPYFINEPNP